MRTLACRMKRYPKGKKKKKRQQQLTGATEECDSEDEESDLEKGSFKQRGEQYGPHDLFPPEAENETPGKWVESASETISAFVNDPAFTFSRVRIAWTVGRSIVCV